MRPRIRLVAALAALSFGTPACDACDVRPPLERKLGAYAEAIDPGAGAVPHHDPALARLPARPQRNLELPRRTIDIASFLALQQCALGELVGHRNSGLGRVLLDSQRWVYEVDFLRQAERCLQQLGAPLRDDLQAVVDAKRQELPVVAWNAIWGGAEIQHLLALSGRDPDPGAGGGGVMAAGALATLHRFVVAPQELHSAALEEALDVLRRTTVGGDTLRALDRLRHYLDVASTRLEALADDPALCERHGERLRAAFTRDYAELVQPHLARTHRAAEPLLAGLWELYRATAGGLPLPPPALAAYAERQLSPEAPDGLWQRYQTAVRRHTAAWQRVGAACGFLPSAGP